jgi:hypothetical protein
MVAKMESKKKGVLRDVTNTHVDKVHEKPRKQVKKQ